MFHTASPWEPAPAATPPGTTILAVGDVHGCAAQLDALVTVLAGVVAEAGSKGRAAETVLLGDYVDRGPDSLGVLDRLPLLPARLGCPVTALVGNHDLAMREALRPAPTGEEVAEWAWMGGTVLRELGVPPPRVPVRDPAGFAAVARDALGAARLAALDGLVPLHRAGGYLFVHGGVHPALPLEEHALHDLVWMREPFLETDRWPHDFAVVHGHTILGPQVRRHRVGTDAGCFHTGILAAVELEDDRLRFHLVAARPEIGALRGVLDPREQRSFARFVPIATAQPNR